MSELAGKIAREAGITEEQAGIAISSVVAELKQKFPQLLHQEIDNALAGKKFGDPMRARLEELKDRLEDAARQFGQRAETVFNEANDKINQMFRTDKNQNSGNNNSK